MKLLQLAVERGARPRPSGAPEIISHALRNQMHAAGSTALDMKGGGRSTEIQLRGQYSSDKKGGGQYSTDTGVGSAQYWRACSKSATVLTCSWPVQF
eukprot:2037870-Rhodomonas_salina.2